MLPSDTTNGTWVMDERWMIIETEWYMVWLMMTLVYHRPLTIPH